MPATFKSILILTIKAIDANVDRPAVLVTDYEYSRGTHCWHADGFWSCSSRQFCQAKLETAPCVWLTTYKIRGLPGDIAVYLSSVLWLPTSKGRRALFLLDTDGDGKDEVHVFYH